MKSRRRRRAGFTLLEVLLVLAILVVLASSVTFYFSNTQKNANIRAARLQVENISQLLEQYHIDVGSYPDDLASLRAEPAGLAAGKWAGPYGSRDIEPDPWNQEYQFERNGDTFRVWSFGPDGQDGTDDDVSVSK